ncbi:pentapeptide repeat-containing protein [Rhizohabitans arisaemae]|uniref:pentapeptide repeat-containing protein n=1 Tax=Rhizohabitans arisaemae TaxID=2720610 RepID=UPI0024B22DF2|nr:pentapeptide repeat-containing protein [Rhizohabitans arisaemae]
MCSAESCSGTAATPYDRCLAHLDREELDRALADLGPGRMLDVRGVVITAELLAVLLGRIGQGLGRVRFDGAVIACDAWFSGRRFQGDVSFDGTRFLGAASFYGVRFERNASFRGAHFLGAASFADALFAGYAVFDHAVFHRDAVVSAAEFTEGASYEGTVFAGYACFDDSRFGRDGWFRGARFRQVVSMKGTTFHRDASFAGAVFGGRAWLGPMTVARQLVLTRVRSTRAVTVAAVATRVDCAGGYFADGTTLRLRRAALLLENAVLVGTVRVEGAPRPLPRTCEQLIGEDRQALVLSLRGARLDDLLLGDVDLSGCRFTGLARPDRVRFSGRAGFADLPAGLRRRRGWPPVAWQGGRRILADEFTVPFDPAQVAALYRHLAAALLPEDRRTAADFRYGEMEIRRRNAPRLIERWRLGLHWMLFGYGLRLRRGLVWLLILMLAATFATLTRNGVGSGPTRPHVAPGLRSTGH